MSMFTRRRFLGTSAVLGGSAVALPLNSTRVRAAGPAPQPKKVLVLGAGMSGLTAAVALHRRGHDVQVLEFQNRVGGRLISIPLKKGQFTEGGGGHFRTNMPLVCAYLNKFQLPLIAMNDGCPRYHVAGQIGDGTRLPEWPWNVSSDERNVELAALLARYLVKDGLNLNTVLNAHWPDAATLAKYDRMTLKQLCQRVGASEAFIKLVDAQAAELTVDSAVLSLLPDLAYHFADRNLFRIAGGNQQLPQALAGQLPERIHLNQAVTAIRQTAAGAVVTTQSGREWKADEIVSTIPFTILRDIDIQPKLSPRKQAMIDGMQWSPVVKVYVQTQSPAWLKQGVRGWPMAASDRPWERVIDITGNEPGGHGNVFFYLTGKNALNYLQRPRETRAREIVQQFNADLPGLFDDVVTLGEFSWPDQPWIKAAFADMPVGGGWMIREVKIPEGCMHFAGDFTTLKSGWVEGAIESGLRAAREIDAAAPAEYEV